MDSSDQKPVLLPLPAQVTWTGGAFPIQPGLHITLTGVKEPRVQHAVQRFLDRLQKKTDIDFSSPKTGSQNFTIDCKEKGLPIQSVREDESYSLTVTPSQIQLSAHNPLGILHGLQTLLQLVQSKGKDYSFYGASIQDKPRFAWRGLMIDSCRHWMPLEVIKRNLDGMEEAKFNVFHWHLSENQGFRAESKKFPKLQEMGSEGNYYTQEQMKEIIAYARDRGIRVIPEFDLPGHSTAWFVGYPELASAPGPYTVEKKYGIFDPCFDPSREEVYKFIDGFIGEMAALFPDEYFHIGGDEVNGKHWNENVSIQRFMYAHGLKTNADLQAYFNGRLEEILTRHHKKMVGWDEILRPDLPKNIVVQSWRGIDSLSQAAKQGFDGILSTGYYLDLAHPASAHYVVDPLPDASDLTPGQKAHVLGGETCMWTELVSPETIDSRIWPAALAVAERLWSPASVKDLDDFYNRMEVESRRLEETGLTHRSSYLSMLKRLAGDGDMKPLETLADAVEPVKDYQRHHWGNYSNEFPLTQLVDAVRPESELARHFRSTVNGYLSKAPVFGDSTGIETSLELWKQNHKKLEPILQKSDLLADALFQSQDLSSSAEVGLEALQYLKSGKAAPSSWMDKAQQILNRALQPKAQVEIAVLPSIYKLALAAGQLDKLKSTTADEWNKSLDTQVEAAKNPPKR